MTTQKELLKPYHRAPCEAGNDPHPTTSLVPCTCGLWRAFIAGVNVGYEPAQETT